MMIDCILDRYAGEPYNPRTFYLRALEYGHDEISRAMDSGSSSEVKAALFDYIDSEEYNPKIKNFIDRACWLSSESGRDWRKIVKI